MVLSPPSIHFCTSRDGTRIAYAATGDGPPLVKSVHLASSLETDADHPVLGGMLGEIGRGRTLVRYDSRGMGLSDREVHDFSLERQVEDLQAVVEAVGLSRFALMGLAGGGAVAINYAIRHPERVSRLVLYGAFIQGKIARATTPEAQAEAETLLRLVEVGWGKDDPAFRQLYTSQYVPDGSTEQFRALNELLRRMASPANASRFMRELHRSDLRALAPRLACPALVLHAAVTRGCPSSRDDCWRRRSRGRASCRWKAATTRCCAASRRSLSSRWNSTLSLPHRPPCRPRGRKASTN